MQVKHRLYINAQAYIITLIHNGKDPYSNQIAELVPRNKLIRPTASCLLI